MEQPVPEQVNRPMRPRGIVSPLVGSLPNRGGGKHNRGGVSVEAPVECCGAYSYAAGCRCLEAA